jgi:hypothetical protein
MYLAETAQTDQYDLMVTDKREDAYVRFASHVTYEHDGGFGRTTTDHARDPRSSVETSTTQGLCRFFGPLVFNECANEKDFAYLESLTFQYAAFDLSENVKVPVKEAQLRDSQLRLDMAIQEAMQDTIAEVD